MHYLYIAGPILLWSTQAVLVKSLMSGSVGVFELNVYRAAGALLLGIIYCREESFKDITLKDLVPGTALALNLVAFNAALKFIDAYLLIIIEACCFAFSYLVDRLLRQRVRFSPAILVLYLGGVAFLVIDGLFKQSLAQFGGLFLALLASFFFGAFNATLRFTGGKKNSLVLVMLPVLALNLPAGIWQQDFQALPRDVGSMLLVVGLVQTGSAYILWSLASRFFSGTRLSEFLLLTIPLTFAVEYLALDVSIDAWQVAGSALLIVAAYINIRVYKDN